MRFLTCLSFVFLVPHAAFADGPNLIGTWVGTMDDDNQIRLTLAGDASFKLLNVDPDQPDRVKARISGTYASDLTKTPAHLDLSATSRAGADGNEKAFNHVFPTIIAFDGADAFRMSDLEATKRPAAFGKRTLLMKRVSAD